LPQKSNLEIMKILMTSLLVVLLATVVPAQELNQVVIDAKLQKEVLIGKCDRQGLDLSPFNVWFQEGYQSYMPDENAIRELRKMKKDLKIIVVMGSWCSDSKKNIPAFYKAMDELKFNEKDLQLIAVDSGKSAGDVDIQWLGITKVPTFVLMKNDLEIGRIVENPTLSIEKDMLLILMQAD
jgi:thiol-disulfide isomerase/thioredoxin